MIVDFVGPVLKPHLANRLHQCGFASLRAGAFHFRGRQGSKGGGSPHSWVCLKVGMMSPSPGSGRQGPTSSALALLQLLPPDLTYSLPRTKDRTSCISCRFQGKIEEPGSLDLPGVSVDRNSTANAGAQVWSLVREGSIRLKATKPVNLTYWACALEPWSHNYWSLCA